MGRIIAAQHVQDWIVARKRFHLSHAHVQMARELGMNPRKLGKLDNHHQEPWKVPLPRFIELLYARRFGRERSETVLSIEELACTRRAEQLARKQAKRRARAERDAGRPADEGVVAALKLTTEICEPRSG